MLSHIKKWSYNKKLQQKQSEIRPAQIGTVNVGRQIGILYELEQLDDQAIIKTLKLEMGHDGRIVKSLSYIDQKIDIQNLAQRTFSKKELKWNGVPDSHYVDEFINWEFDILICPIKHMRVCYEYIIKLAPAKLRVGINCENAEKLYDLIIDVPADMALAEILDQILNHLKIVSH